MDCMEQRTLRSPASRAIGLHVILNNNAANSAGVNDWNNKTAVRNDYCRLFKVSHFSVEHFILFQF